MRCKRQRIKPFVDLNGYVCEFFVAKAILDKYELLSKGCLQVFLDSLEMTLPACLQNGYMRKFYFEEVMGKIRGNWVNVDKSSKIPETISRIFDKNYITSKPIEFDNNLNGKFLDPWTGSVNSAAVPSLKDSVAKLKEVLTCIRNNAPPESRDARLPISSSMLKLTLIEDPGDSGEVHEDVIVRIYEEAFPSMSTGELYQIVSLGRRGKVAERRIDYMQMFESLERLFLKPTG